MRGEIWRGGGEEGREGRSTQVEQTQTFGEALVVLIVRFALPTSMLDLALTIMGSIVETIVVDCSRCWRRGGGGVCGGGRGRLRRLGSA